MFRRAARPSLLLVVALLSCAAAPAGFARDQIDAGFNLDQLVALGGAGPDPGPADPEARLRWAIATAIPVRWSDVVPVQWSIGENSHLALSYVDGQTEVTPGALQRSAEVLLWTVAHEMGHQIAIALAPGGRGDPPQPFVDLLPGSPYTRYSEGWADCVSRVWTGSLRHTSSEANPCPVGAARYVAVLLADPENFQPKVEEPEPSGPSLEPPPPSAEPFRLEPVQEGGRQEEVSPISVQLALLLAGPLAVAFVLKVLKDFGKTGH